MKHWLLALSLMTCASSDSRLQHRLCRDSIGVLLAESISSESFHAIAGALVYWNRQLGRAVLYPDRFGRLLVEERSLRCVGACETIVPRYVMIDGCLAGAVLSIPEMLGGTTLDRFVRDRFGQVLGLPARPTDLHYRALQRAYGRER